MLNQYITFLYIDWWVGKWLINKEATYFYVAIYVYRNIKKLGGLMVIERDVEIIENGINEIIKLLREFKTQEKSVDINNIEELKERLDTLEKAQILEKVLNLFYIYSYEQEDIKIKITKDWK